MTLSVSVREGQGPRVSKAGCLAEAQHSIGLRRGHAGIGCPLRMETRSAYRGMPERRAVHMSFLGEAAARERQCALGSDVRAHHG